jgi:hypothetical protein
MRALFLSQLLWFQLCGWFTLDYVVCLTPFLETAQAVRGQAALYEPMGMYAPALSAGVPALPVFPTPSEYMGRLRLGLTGFPEAPLGSMFGPRPALHQAPYLRSRHVSPTPAARAAAPPTPPPHAAPPPGPVPPPTTHVRGSAAKPRAQCQKGSACKFFATGTCRYRHDGPSSPSRGRQSGTASASPPPAARSRNASRSPAPRAANMPSAPAVVVAESRQRCKNGDGCRFLAAGNCRYSHEAPAPPEPVPAPAPRPRGRRASPAPASRDRDASLASQRSRSRAASRSARRPRASRRSVSRAASAREPSTSREVGALPC